MREKSIPQYAVVLRDSTQKFYFRYLGWIGEPGSHRQAPHVCEYSEAPQSWCQGVIAAPPSPSSLSRQVLRDLEVGYVVYFDNACCGSVIPAIGLQGYVTDISSVTALLDR